MGMKLPSLTEVPQGLTSWHEWDTQGLAWWKLHECHDPERGAPAPFNHWKHLKTSQTFQKLSPAETTSFKIIAFFQITRKTVNMYHSWYVTAFFCLFFFSGSDGGAQQRDVWFVHCPVLLSTQWYHFCLWLSWILSAYTNAQSLAGLGKNWPSNKMSKSRKNNWSFLQLPRNSQILWNSDSLPMLLSYLIV